MSVELWFNTHSNSFYLHSIYFMGICSSSGLDAIVREFKSGRVTLRRNRRRTGTSEALQEMFQVLEISQKQNRNSKICVDLNTTR